MKVSTRIYCGIVSPDPPAMRWSWDGILRQARNSLASREKGYPDQIRAGTIDQDKADREIALWRSIVDDWHWIMTGEGQPAPEASRSQRIAAIDASLSTIAKLARERGGCLDEFNGTANFLIAMRWHYEAERAPYDIYFIARCNHEIRRRQVLETASQCEVRKAA